VNNELSRKIFKTFVTTVAMTGIAIATSDSILRAQDTMLSSDDASQSISSSSNPIEDPFFARRLRPGAIYTFDAQAGDEIAFFATPTAGSEMNLQLVVVPPDGESFPINNSSSVLDPEGFQVSSAKTAGKWTVNMFSFNNQPGEFQISLLIRRDGQVIRKETISPTEEPF
jgi:hypothetical protein